MSISKTRHIIKTTIWVILLLCLTGLITQGEWQIEPVLASTTLGGEAAYQFLNQEGLLANIAENGITSGPGLDDYKFVDELTPPNGEKNDFFGYAVDVDGNTAVIGAFSEDTEGIIKSGAAYVYNKEGGEWLLITKLVPQTLNQYGRFGLSVAIDGDSIAIGSCPNANDGNTSPGTVIMFEKMNGSWTEIQTLIAADREPEDCFGWAIDMDENRLIVGARNAPKGTTENVGAAYLFEQFAFDWKEVHKFSISASDDQTHFGNDVAIDGNNVIVGAHWGGTDNRGIAYIYTEGSNGSWYTEGTLKSGYEGSVDTHTWDRFGFSVDIEGDTAVVGAPYHDGDDPENNNEGRVFVYKLNNFDIIPTWNLAYELSASDARENDLFGTAVQIDNGQIVVGSHFADVLTPFDTEMVVDAGALYLYWDSNNGPVLIEKIINSSAAANDQLGFFNGVAFDSGNIFTGYRNDLPGAQNAGGVLIAHKTAAPWQIRNFIKPREVEVSGFFGLKLASDGNTLVIGAPFQDFSTVANSGRLYIYQKDQNNHWEFVTELFEPTNFIDETNYFGLAIDIAGDTIIVGAPGSGDGGAAYVFVNQDNEWRQFGERIPAPDGAENVNFGHAVAINENTFIVTDDQAEISGKSRIGAAYVFELHEDHWEQSGERLTEDVSVGDRFGTAVDVDGDVMVVTHTAPYSKSGNAYLYYRQSDGEWILNTVINPSTDSNDIRFGANVLLKNHLLFVAAPDDETESQLNGAVYVYEKTGNNWEEQIILRPFESILKTNNPNFGVSLDYYDGTLAVGATYLNNIGSVFVFKHSEDIWEIDQVLTPYSEEQIRYGRAVALSDGQLFVGSPYKEISSVPQAGLVYLYEKLDNDAPVGNNTHLFLPIMHK
ncbi:MAG: hypothetical protein AAF490_22350 [Chloroflexota bacterium]